MTKNLFWIAFIVLVTTLQAAAQSTTITKAGCSSNAASLQFASGDLKNIPAASCYGMRLSQGKRYAAWQAETDPGESLFVFDGTQIVQPDFTQNRRYVDFQFEPDDTLFIETGNLTPAPPMQYLYDVPLRRILESCESYHLESCKLLFKHSHPELETYSKIDDVNFARLVAAKSACALDAYIDTPNYVDLTGDGKPEAIVVAWTCNTGNAGPDIHDVYTLSADGKIVELQIGDDRRENAGRLFGNRNSDLQVEDGKLVQRWSDTSGRKDPLVVRYRWDGSMFRPQTIQAARPFKPSYDCSRATVETEAAICYVESLAQLDVRLSQVYGQALKATSPKQRPLLQDEQRAWVNKRNTECTIYKWWVECLTKMYETRIDELTPKKQ
jgi:uncharacterized protein YecT (DUF1311 family)